MLDSVSTTVIVGYGLLILFVGAAAFHRQDRQETFFLGEQSLGTLQFLGTTFPTFFGTGLVFTLASFGYLYGIGAFLLPGAAALGFVLFAQAAPRIKRASDREDAITLPALFDGVWSMKTRAVAALVTVSLFAGTLAANFLVAGNLLQSLYGIPTVMGISGFAGIVLAYTALGGFRGVVRTDILQTGVIGVSLVVILPAFVFLEGGATVFGSLPSSHLDPLSLPVQILVVYLLIGVFAYFGSQDLFQRIYATKDEHAARRGVLSFTVVVLLISAVTVGLGISARALFPGIRADRALVVLTSEIVPAGFSGIAVLGFLALANAGADAKLLTITSNITEDFLPHINAKFGRQVARIERLVVVGIGLIALAVAVVAPTLTALLAGLGSWFAILGVVVVATLYWNRMTDTAAFTGLVVGFVAPVIFITVTGDVQAATLVGLIPTVLVVVVVSLLTSSKSETDSSGGGAIKSPQ
jgi:Na+/proline symporter